MALPILSSPKFDLRIPSSGKLVEYRPFLVKEEKILLIAQESGDSKQMLNAMKDIVRACTYDKVNPNDLTSYDLEFVFLKLRSKSIGETSTVRIKCKDCDDLVPVEINLDDIIAPEVSSEQQTIMLSNSVGIKMRHIRVKDLSRLADEKRSKGDQIVDTVVASIESIFDEKNVYPTDDADKKELEAFVGSLSRTQMAKIEEFIASTPKIEHTVRFTCKNGHENEITLSGIQSFFG